MLKRINLKEIADKNPKIDQRLLTESLRLSAELKRNGLERPVNRLATPFTRRRAVVRYSCIGE